MPPSPADQSETLKASTSGSSQKPEDDSDALSHIQDTALNAAFVKPSLFVGVDTIDGARDSKRFIRTRHASPYRIIITGFVELSRLNYDSPALRPTPITSDLD